MGAVNGFLSALIMLQHMPALVAVDKPPTVAVGWTPAATMGALQAAATLLVGGGGLKILANHLLQLRQIAEAKAKRVDDRADGITERLTERVTELETAMSTERTGFASQLASERERFAREIAEERRECDERVRELQQELREMQQRMDGFMRGLVQFQSSEARLRPESITPEMGRALHTLDGLEAVRDKGTGE